MASRSEVFEGVAWWLTPGNENCEFCLQSLHYEAGYHCHGCDQFMCHGCTVALFESRSVLCPDCSSGGAAL